MQQCAANLKRNVFFHPKWKILSSRQWRWGESNEKCTLPPILVGSGFVVKRLLASTNYKLRYNTWLSQEKVVWSSCGSVLHAEDFLAARHHDYPTFSLSRESSKIEILEPSPPFGHCCFFCPPQHHRRRQSICYRFTNYFFTHPPLPEVRPMPELLGTQKLTVFSFHIA